ncbi:MAG: hypothetical protein ACJZ17_08480 [Acidimicrobiales bacterium]|nr:MAG: hypothetical protein MB52_00515 [marine actinobacterium MedAcidi-G1]MAU34721.1 hypothetical protein [Actinomycetota bacterium]MCH1514774.1 hypothetical protein [Acidimicrobiales bacterium]HAQ04910.1 hypothetical protein [Acidimicrobiaceae bacterium]
MIEIEKAGVPAVVFTTENFKELTRSAANSLGIPKARIVVVPHPLGGTEKEVIVSWAKSAIDDLLKVLEA